MDHLSWDILQQTDVGMLSTVLKNIVTFEHNMILT